jgi:uncharacterized protein
MIGPILLLLTWILLRVERRSLAAIGIDKPFVRMRQFGVCVLLSGLAATAQQIGFALAVGTSWHVNSAIDTSTVLGILRFTTNSVLFEELLFRGYILFQVIRLLGRNYGVLIDAIAFGIYHWFSFGVFGNVPAMIYVFLLTGGFGLMCALAFVSTKSIAAPVGLHFGWNFITYIVFSSGPQGQALLLPSNGEARLRPSGGAGLLLGFAFPILFVVLVSVYLLRRSKLPIEGPRVKVA